MTRRPDAEIAFYVETFNNDAVNLIIRNVPNAAGKAKHQLQHDTVDAFKSRLVDIDTISTLSCRVPSKVVEWCLRLSAGMRGDSAVVE
ncbi:hypothetical protein HPB50_003714 [Hyalomma asiaticum]|uniref:Uncharacterized protein n=1 Tax=Hyalomma asiaticum TaxID=266040 RepID=A0ACB7ST06_HYAAI|nr:hypothetical protein HPB50_003714 [Hyalomma asiaticum]